mgnify:CR=1 FL=1
MSCTCAGGVRVGVALEPPRGRRRRAGGGGGLQLGDRWAELLPGGLQHERLLLREATRIPPILHAYMSPNALRFFTRLTETIRPCSYPQRALPAASSGAGSSVLTRAP